jgi:hypothetical protein
MSETLLTLVCSVVAKEGSAITVESLLSPPMTNPIQEDEQVELPPWSTTRCCTKVPEAELSEPDIAIQPRTEILPARSTAASTIEAFADSDSFQPPGHTGDIQRADDLPVAKRRKAKPASARVKLSEDPCPALPTTGVAPAPPVVAPLESELEQGMDHKEAKAVRQPARPMRVIALEDELTIARFAPPTLPSNSVLPSVPSRIDASASLTRFLSNRHNLSNAGGGYRNDRDGERFTPQQAASSPTSVSMQTHESHLQTDAVLGVQVNGDPQNPPEIEEAVDSIIRSPKSLEYVPLMVNNEIYNKRPLISALDRFHIQLHGYDSLEADFLLDPRTGCLHLPLASLPAMMDQLIRKAIMLAQRFEHLIFIFALYPTESRRTENLILPNPWSKAVQDAFDVFKGRVKRQIILEYSPTYQGSFTHQVDVYLSDSSVTLAALLRLHTERCRMPSGPSNFSEWTTAFGEEANDWLDVGLKEVCIRRNVKMKANNCEPSAGNTRNPRRFGAQYRRRSVHRGSIWKQTIPRRPQER